MLDMLHACTHAHVCVRNLDTHESACARKCQRVDTSRAQAPHALMPTQVSASKRESAGARAKEPRRQERGAEGVRQLGEAGDQRQSRPGDADLLEGSSRATCLKRPTAVLLVAMSLFDRPFRSVSPTVVSRFTRAVKSLALSASISIYLFICLSVCLNICG